MEGYNVFGNNKYARMLAKMAEMDAQMGASPAKSYADAIAAVEIEMAIENNMIVPPQSLTEQPILPQEEVVPNMPEEP